ncbi:MAG: pyridoxamine 5'-phosphate oxidase [Verrucomicrobiales bacterium]|nr:pyridoxamine 5'-phosphate oxidase [Verrucomicrobiales bacterium]
MSDSFKQSIAEMRQDYRAGDLYRNDLADSPIDQFAEWFDQAVKSEIREPNTMTLCTVGDDGIPNARTVLMKDFGTHGVTFYTNYESRKGRELLANPGASVLFFWKELERQVHVRGRVSRASHADSEAYFFSRPYDARIGAWASIQSREIPNRRWLADRAAEFEAKFPDDGTPGCVPLPDFWGGYYLEPVTVEFWQGQPGRKHDRFIYSLEGGNWRISRLSP